MSEADRSVSSPSSTHCGKDVQFEPCAVPIPQDGRIYRHFPLLTGGSDKVLDALHICHEVLRELEEGADIEANLRYLIARFTYQLPFQINQGKRLGE